MTRGSRWSWLAAATCLAGCGSTSWTYVKRGDAQLFAGQTAIELEAVRFADDAKLSEGFAEMFSAELSKRLAAELPGVRLVPVGGLEPGPPGAPGAAGAPKAEPSRRKGGRKKKTVPIPEPEPVPEPAPDAAAAVRLRLRCTPRDINNPMAAGLGQRALAAMENRLDVEVEQRGEIREQVYFVAEGRWIGPDAADAAARFTTARAALLFDTVEELSEHLADFVRHRLAGGS